MKMSTGRDLSPAGALYLIIGESFTEEVLSRVNEQCAGHT